MKRKRIRGRYNEDPIERAEMRWRAIDNREVEQLMSEGLSYQEALLYAATTMDGVREKEDGEVLGTQTYCDTLHPKSFRERFGRRGGEKE